MMTTAAKNFPHLKATHKGDTRLETTPVANTELGSWPYVDAQTHGPAAKALFFPVHQKMGSGMAGGTDAYTAAHNSSKRVQQALHPPAMANPSDSICCLLHVLSHHHAVGALATAHTSCKTHCTRHSTHAMMVWSFRPLPAHIYVGQIHAELL